MAHLARVIGIYFILLGLVFMMIFGMSESSGLYSVISAVFSILAIGLVGLKNWARIGLNFFIAVVIIGVVINSLIKGMLADFKTCVVLSVSLSPAMIFSLAKVKSCFK